MVRTFFGFVGFKRQQVYGKVSENSFVFNLFLLLSGIEQLSWINPKLSLSYI